MKLPGSGYRERAVEACCVVCGEHLLERSELPYIPAVSGNLIGPGSRNVATEADRQVRGWHCGRCGLEYRQLPKVAPCT